MCALKALTRINNQFVAKRALLCYVVGNKSCQKLKSFYFYLRNELFVVKIQMASNFNAFKYFLCALCSDMKLVRHLCILISILMMYLRLLLVTTQLTRSTRLIIWQLKSKNKAKFVSIFIFYFLKHFSAFILCLSTVYLYSTHDFNASALTADHVNTSSLKQSAIRRHDNCY